MVQHYICDKCGYDTTQRLDYYLLPKSTIHNISVHLCPNCVEELSEWVNTQFLSPNELGKDSVEK